MKIGERTIVWHPELSNIGDCVIGDDCKIHSHVWISDGVIIGNKVKIQAFAFIPKGVIIKDRVFVGPRVTFTNDKRPPSGNWSATVIEEGASIGAGAVILPNLIVGKNAVIGAGAVVTKSVPAGETWVGVPARKLGGA